MKTSYKNLLHKSHQRHQNSAIAYKQPYLKNIDSMKSDSKGEETKSNDLKVKTDAETKLTK